MRLGVDDLLIAGVVVGESALGSAGPASLGGSRGAGTHGAGGKVFESGGIGGVRVSGGTETDEGDGGGEKGKERLHRGYLIEWTMQRLDGCAGIPLSLTQSL